MLFAETSRPRAHRNLNSGKPPPTHLRLSLRKFVAPPRVTSLVQVLRRAKAVPFLGEKVVACQMEYSPFELTIEKDGFLEAAREAGVAVVAYSPLGRGLATGR